MSDEQKRSDLARELRKAAEEKARSLEMQELEALSPEETRQMLHELRVHQIELEMQNEELRRAQEELNISRARYFDLYDLVPVGYCTLSEKGLILEANRAAATLLGVSCGALVKQLISRFILQEDQEIYYLHRRQLFQTGKPQSFELRMVKNDETAFWAYLEMTAALDADGAPVCRAVLNDITERKQAAVLLQEFIENNPISVQIVDKDGFTLKVNPAHTLLFGAVPPSDFSIFTDLQQKYPNSEKLILLAKKGEVARFPDLYYNAHDVSSKFPDKLVCIRAILFPLSTNNGIVENFVMMHENITERKQAVDALRESENKYRQLIETLQDGVYRSSHEGRFLEVNSAMVKILGYDSKEELLAIDIPSQLYFVQEDRQSAALDEKLIEMGVFRLRKKDGSEIWVEDHGRHVVDDKGTILYHEGILRDITERKLAEVELQKLASVVRYSSELVNLSTLDGKMIFLNEAGSRLLGIPPDEVEQTHIMQVIPDPFKDKVENELMPALVKTGTWAGELQYINLQTGQITDVHAITFVVKDPMMEEPMYLANVSIDITDRKRAEESLRESEEKFKAIANYTVNWESWFGPDGQYLWVNPAVESITGYSAEEILTMPDFISTVIAEEDQDLFIARFQDALRGNKGENFEFRYLQKNGAKHWLSASWQPIFDVKGNFLGVRSSGRDITDRKQAEEAIRISEASLAEAQRLAHLGSWELNLITGQAVWSDELCRLFEIPAETIEKGSSQLRAAIEERIHPDDRARYREAVDQSLHQKIPYDIEYRIRLPDGAQRAIHAQGVPTFDPAGNLVRLAGTAMDITERKQAEDALRTSEASYRLVVENANEAILVAQDGMLKFVNRMAIELTGYSEQELTSRPFPEFIHPDDWGMVVERHLSRLEGDTSLPRYAFRLIAHDGSIKWLEIDALLIEWEGRPATLNFLADITERKRAEEALQSAKEFSENILMAMSDGFVLLDSIGVHVNVNPSFCKMTGFTRQELIGVGLPHPYWPPEEQARISKAFQKTLEQNFENLELTFMRKNGEHFPVLINPSAITDRQGNALYFFATVYDITERKRAEEAIWESEKRYREIFDSSNDALFIQDIATGSILDVNKTMLEMYGYADKQEALKCAIEDLGAVEEGYNEEKIEEMNHKAINLNSNSFEWRAKKKNGEVFWAQVSLQRTQISGEDRIIASVRDITERKRLEQEMTKARADFLFAVSHELKTPLFLMAASQELLESLPEEQRAGRFLEYGEIWDRNLHRLRHLIDNLVDSQRTEGMGLKITLVPTDMREILQQTLKDVDLLARRRRISFHLQLDELPPIPADPESIHRLFENLLTNAVKFSSTGGEVEISLTLEGEEALFAVRDYGPGIPTLEIPQLFQPFQRTTGSNRAVIPGTGLGLYTAKLIAEAHGGSISLASEEGKGTTVAVRLPLNSGITGT